MEIRMENYMQAGAFKNHCLSVLDQIKRNRKRIIITKRGKPVAQLVPLEEKEEHLFGKLKGSVHILGDIINSTD